MKTNVSHEPYVSGIAQEAMTNTDFRRVLDTTERSQLVLMSVPPGGEIGQETHADNDQVLFIVGGRGEAIFDDRRHAVSSGTVVVVPAGTQHNFVATTAEALKLFTIYTPPHHRPGTVHATKADADADTADHY